MSPSTIHVADVSRRIRRPTRAPLRPPIASVRRRTDVAAHRYTLPVVRELPLRLADGRGDRTW
jgi:hypothetical protein